MPLACIVHAAGCPRAEVDTALLLDYFEANGWAISDSIGQADMVVVTACSFCSAEEERGFYMLAAVDRRRRAGSKMAIVGCIAGISQERLRRAFDAAVIPQYDMSQLDDLIGASVPIRGVPDPHDVGLRVDLASRNLSVIDRPPRQAARLLTRDILAKSRLGDWMANRGYLFARDFAPRDPELYSIRVAAGCMSDCAYCAIGKANGPLRSKPLSAVLAEFDAGRAEGRTAFRLLAQDLGAYGQDIDSTVVELLRSIFERDGDFTLWMSDFNAGWLVRYSSELVRMLAADSARIAHLAVPIQSGSDRILRLMRRGHTASQAEDALVSLRAAAPGLQISTHILVGFPGETEDDFEETLRLLRLMHFDRVDVYEYSDRPGTSASSMPGGIPRREIRSRARRALREFPSESDLERKNRARHLAQVT